MYASDAVTDSLGFDQRYINVIFEPPAFLGTTAPGRLLHVEFNIMAPAFELEPHSALAFKRRIVWFCNIKHQFHTSFVNFVLYKVM